MSFLTDIFKRLTGDHEPPIQRIAKKIRFETERSSLPGIGTLATFTKFFESSLVNAKVYKKPEPVVAAIRGSENIMPEMTTPKAPERYLRWPEKKEYGGTSLEMSSWGTVHPIPVVAPSLSGDLSDISLGIHPIVNDDGELGLFASMDIKTTMREESSTI